MFDSDMEEDGASQRMAMFPGQGSQFVGMGVDWYEEYKEVREAFEEASDFSRLDLKKLCFHDSDDELKLTPYTQPAILTVSVAIYRVLNERFDLDIKNFLGHSLGEYSALVAAGVMSLGPSALLVHLRGKYMQDAVPVGEGGMSAVLFRDHLDSWETVTQLCADIRKSTNGFVYPANQNAFEQVVVAGKNAELKIFEKEAPQKIGCRRVLRLPVSAPFHCPLMGDAANRLSEELTKVKFQGVSGKRYIANVDAQTYSLSDGTEIPKRLISQITEPVLWRQSLDTALVQGCKMAIEFGPGNVLGGLAKKFHKDGQSIDAMSFSKAEDIKNFEKVFN